MSLTQPNPQEIQRLLKPYLGAKAPGRADVSADWDRICGQLAVYLDLILKWNARINLTAIRDPEEIVRRHFGESLFAGLHLEAGGSNMEPCDSLLDLGSGAGFPGIPIQLLRPELKVTLAESRTRKAAFLREAVRTLGLSTEVWADRAEAMAPEWRFHTVALRAVDDMSSAVAEAARRASRQILILGTVDQPEFLSLGREFDLGLPTLLPNSSQGALLVATRR
ncbi:MAG TPA: 16S rRNA (guanine(527)-N(7))-methyltransferase RsmG [Acidobacteriaceae bacterium]|nr:16S rRNA (guanine(527)-N(7))-methyltransferase RsmG [Acidobacteriaceae bacterium]